MLFTLLQDIKRDKAAEQIHVVEMGSKNTQASLPAEDTRILLQSNLHEHEKTVYHNYPDAPF